MSAPTIRVVTASFGGYDILRPQRAQDLDVEWIAYTDEPALDAPRPWQVRYVDAAAGEHPRMAAKRYKMWPTSDSPDVVWIDANTEVVDPSFVRRALLARRNGIAVWQHPDRDCIYDEAEASLRLRPEAYADQPIAEQVAHYRAQGHQEHAGLWACGTVAWDWSVPTAVLIASRWWQEITRWSWQDQLSLPVVLRSLDVEPGTFPGRQTEKRGRRWVGNRWQRIHPHLVAA